MTFSLKAVYKHLTEQKHAFVYPYPLYRVSLAADPEPEPGSSPVLEPVTYPIHYANDLVDPYPVPFIIEVLAPASLPFRVLEAD